jgi:pantoate--beta-alanine ligase
VNVVSTVAGLNDALMAAPRPLGLVPTMGSLHEGHLSLVRLARAENTATAVSIFVNPTQFGPRDDLRGYPRDMDRDLGLLEAEGVGLVFAPPAEEVYPPGFDTWVEVGALARRLEGESRPGHFRGVCTVVLKLFALFRPDRAYFGQKDAQQALVVRRMAQDLSLGVGVVVGPTVRDADGLALSSRNSYLSPRERQAAPVLYRALGVARRCYNEGGRDAGAIREQMRTLIASESLAGVDYVSVADAETLEELETVEHPALVSLAVRIGKTRLIDNILLP